MRDDEVDAAIDRVGRELTTGDGRADLPRQVLARLSAQATDRQFSWWMVAPVAGVVVAVGIVAGPFWGESQQAPPTQEPLARTLQAPPTQEPLARTLQASPTQEPLARMLVWVDRQGSEEPIELPPHAYASVRLAPDGRRAALGVRDDDSEIWIVDFVRETLMRLTFTGGQNPFFSPDGEWLGFLASGKLMRVAVRGGPALTLCDPCGGAGGTWGPDDTIVFSGLDAEGRSRLFQVPAIGGMPIALTQQAGDLGVETLLAREFDESNPEFSPDGRWITYQGNQSGQWEVYVRPFPNVDDRRWQVSVDGGQEPVWARDGSELFYRDLSGRVVSVFVQTEPEFRLTLPAVLFEGPYSIGTGSTYDVAPDTRFLMIK